MRSVRFCVLLSILLLNIPVWAQRDQTATTLPPVFKDPQAVMVLNQALSITGGIAAINVIEDYTVAGTVTYHLAQNVQGSAMLRGLGLGQFRMDANLPSGVRSEADSGYSTSKVEDGPVRQNQGSVVPSRLGIPHLLLAPALNSKAFSVLYKGLVEIDGHSVHDIQLEHVSPIPDPNGQFREYHMIDFFIDAATFQVLVMQDVVPNHTMRQIRYSDYKPVGGVLVPFSINEHLNGQLVWEINVGTFAFNSGLLDSDFVL